MKEPGFDDAAAVLSANLLDRNSTWSSRDKFFDTYPELLSSFADAKIRESRVNVDSSLRCELRERLVWSICFGGSVLSQAYDWDDCAARVDATLRAYEHQGQKEHGGTEVKFLMGTSDGLGIDTNKLIHAGRGTNDYRSGVYVFEPTDDGRDLAASAATISSIHEFKGGNPVIVTLGVQESLLNNLLRIDLYEVANPELVNAGIARQFDSAAGPFPATVAHVYNYYDCIRGPLSFWSQYGWRTSRYVQMVFRSLLAMKSLSVLKIEKVPRVMKESKDELDEYEAYWRKLQQSYVDKRYSVQATRTRWSRVSGLPTFNHEHPMFYAVPNLLDVASCKSISVSERFELIDKLLLSAGVTSHPQLVKIHSVLSSYAVQE